MARVKEITGKLELGPVRMVRLRLKAIDATIEAVEGELRDGGELWTFKLPSLMTGLEKLEAASFELQRALTAKVSGIPYNEDTIKGREVGTTDPTKRPVKKKKPTKKKR